MEFQAIMECRENIFCSVRNNLQGAPEERNVSSVLGRGWEMFTLSYRFPTKSKALHLIVVQKNPSVPNSRW